MSADTLLAEINAQNGTAWTLVGRVAGGHQTGAWELRDASGHRAILKFGLPTHWATRNLRLPAIVDELRAAGWPTPQWRAIGADSTGHPYHVQDWVVGQAMQTIGNAEVDLILALVERQAGLAPAIESDWSEYVKRVLFEEDDARVVSRLKGSSQKGAQVAAAFTSLCHGYDKVVLPTADLVHGDLATHNVLVADGEVSGVIDVEQLGRGTRAYDLACLVREGFMWRGDAEAVRRLYTAGSAIVGREAMDMCIACTAILVALFVADRSPEGFPSVAAGALRLADALKAWGGRH